MHSPTPSPPATVTLAVADLSGRTVALALAPPATYATATAAAADALGVVEAMRLLPPPPHPMPSGHTDELVPDVFVGPGAPPLLAVMARPPVDPPPPEPGLPPSMDEVMRVTSAAIDDDDASLDRAHNVCASVRELVSSLLGIPVDALDADEASQDVHASSTPQPARVPPPVAAGPLAALTDMGFPEAHARKALMLAGDSVARAMEWLLLHEGDPSLDAPLSEEELQRVGVLAPSAAADASATGAIAAPPPSSAGDAAGEPSVSEHTESLDADPFQPNADILASIRDMGFPDDDIIAALRATDNHEEATVAWLLGDFDTADALVAARRPGANEGAPSDGSLGVDDVTPSIDTQSPIVQAIVNNPTIQAGLRKPHVLQAFHMLLTDPSSAVQLINDPEVGPILLRIHTIISNLAARTH
ncbi:ubiquitin-associated domain-containing protein 1 [Thecamonas trahens ATCC 50062]|uniref:Ubiquitin-associated domain-containing protein 1 n=1 Tax=Thecamonas trahens ATCC 50062 TaxID=461836 RepID=A0A0L0DVR1_THETB|nr:ubiquitin-associated domain-containing protein 1 [Thecamonas trahens ATCC 50062]KNC56310.1 ubiquitin-associated domain-containing protein 1 [Thecamonas trahens ATCC 50062]|eukprot:XP_013760829.1 ubiquitin-associated domain-containing protein 1 [Thecamonas trahens ATCC 50062]